jgi:hypothetical protein
MPHLAEEEGPSSPDDGEMEDMEADMTVREPIDAASRRCGSPCVAFMARKARYLQRPAQSRKPWLSFGFNEFGMFKK